MAVSELIRALASALSTILDTGQRLVLFCEVQGEPSFETLGLDEAIESVGLLQKTPAGVSIRTVAVFLAFVLAGIVISAFTEQIAAMLVGLSGVIGVTLAAAVRFLEATEVRTRVDQGWLLLDDPERTVRLETARALAPLLRHRLPDKFRVQLMRAVEEYAQAQQVNAERPESHLNLGLIAAAVGDTKKAERAYRTAMRLDPAFAPAYVNLADLYRQQGRDVKGEGLLRLGIDRRPRSQIKVCQLIVTCSIFIIRGAN